MSSLLELQRRRKAARIVAPLPARNENIPPSSPLSSYNTGTSLPSNPTSESSSPSPLAQTPAIPQRLPPLVPPPPRTQAPLTLEQRIAYGEGVIKKLKITDERQLPLIREFLETTHPEQREILSFCIQTRNHSEATSQAIQAAETWAPTPAQTKIIRQHAQMILLLPDLKFFNGALQKAITSAITTKSRHGFPTEANDSAFDEFERVAARQVSLAKNGLKTKINAAIKKKTPVAQLANELIASFGKGLEHTLAFHQHIALIRMHIEKGHSGHSFWEKIDADLDELYAAPPEDCVESMQLAYILDKEKYPSRSSAESYPFGNDASQSAKRWIQVLNTAAKKVGRGEQGDRTRAPKRRVGDRDDSDDDEEEEEEQPARQQTEEGPDAEDWDDDQGEGDAETPVTPKPS